jgi:hypothetical protein
MKKWLDKYEIPEAQNGIEGTMGGLTDKGFNYNPAWGGAWKNGGNLQPPMAGVQQPLPMYAAGGNLPGSVGFTYARTGSTPSEGPYAKKTLPSAQNGQEMSFYQHGLDWTPRNISKNGSEILMAQGGEDIPYWMKRSSDVSQRGNQNLKTEIAAQKTKEKKAQEARTRTTIGADTRTAKQKEKDRQAYESKLKYEKEVLGKDFETPQYIQDKNRARAEHLIHLADVGSMGAGLITGAGELVTKQLPKVGEYLTTQTPLKNTWKLNPYANRLGQYNRVVGQDAILDLQQSGLVRSGMGAPTTIGGINVSRPTAFPSFAKGAPRQTYINQVEQTGQTPFVISTDRSMGASTLGRHGKGTTHFPVDESGNYLSSFPANEARVYEATPNWLRGYKQVKPTSVNSSVDDVGNTSIGSDLNLLFSNINPKNLKTQSGTNWMKSWYSDPDFLRRYTVGPTADANATQAYILSKLEQYQPKNYLNLLKDKGLSQYLDKSITTGGVSWGVPESIYVNRTMYAPFNKKGLESVRVHELTHLAEHNGLMLRYEDDRRLLKPFGLSSVDEIPKNSRVSKKESLAAQYYLDPTEIHARMNQARFDLGLTPKDKFTEQMFDKISKNKNWYGMERYIKDKKGFIDLMNNFWAVPPAVIGAAALQGQEDIPQQKKGGVVKDDNGYWNPDNWGKPVEIDSNEITMEGVYEPLLGVSDTGDVQMMYPGEDYVFDGESVTEYPVAKYGINQQDEKTVQHLDQLTNFTNKPKAKSGGWLDKY